MSKELKNAVKEFFEVLDTEEESDSGTIFHPVHISSVRIHLTMRLEKILSIMKREIDDAEE